MRSCGRCWIGTGIGSWGIKDSSGDVERTRRYLEMSADRAHFAVLAGADSRHAALYAAGCAGGVSGLANAVPALVKAIQMAAQSGRDAARAQAPLDRLRSALTPFPALGALKQLVTITSGLPLTYTRPPQRDLSPEEQRALERAVAGYLLPESPADARGLLPESPAKAGRLRTE